MSQLAVLSLGIIFSSLLLSGFFTHLSKFLALKYKILDDPKGRKDKTHKSPIPLLGGLGLVAAGTLVTLGIWLTQQNNWWGLQTQLIQNLNLGFDIFWLFLGVLILTIGGILDDAWTLSSKWVFLYINLALLTVIFGGNLKIESLSYPYNQLIPDWNWMHYLLPYIWLLFCTAATKFMDGHDGLSSTFSLIALLTISSISLKAGIDQPLVFLISLSWAVAIIPFLWQNFPEAKLYLGESASEILGFVIGVLSIISGAKIATASTLVGWFILDIVLVIFIRLWNRQNILKPDRNHWHHRLSDLGLNKIQVLVITTIILLISANLGVAASTNWKLLILPVQATILILSYLLIKLKKPRKLNQKTN